MIITQLFTHKKLNEFAPGDYYGGGDSGGGDSGGGNVFQLTNEELVKLLNSVRPGLGNKWLTDVDQKRFNQLARRDQDRAIFEFDSWLEDLGISTGFMITDIHVNDGKKIWHGFFRNINEQGIAEGSAANDYFTRRKSEEDRIAGVKAPAKNKKNPANTDYAKKRKQQDVTEVESTVAENYETFKKSVADSRAENNKRFRELVALRDKKDATKKKEPKKQGVAEGWGYGDGYDKGFSDGYDGQRKHNPFPPGSKEHKEYDEGWFEGRLDYQKMNRDLDEQGVAENVAGDVNSKKRYHFLYPHVPLDMHTDHEYNDLSDRDLQAVKSHQRELAYKLGKPGAEEKSDIASHIQINRARSQYDQEQAHRRKVLDAEKIKRQARDAKRQQGVAEGSNDTIYPNAEVIKSKNGKPVGEIYQDGNSWGAFHYKADRGYDFIDSREEAIEALKDLHQETGRSRPDYTIKGVAEGSGRPSKKDAVIMAYLNTVSNSPTGTPDEDFLTDWQYTLEEEFGIEMDTAVLANLLPQLDSQVEMLMNKYTKTMNNLGMYESEQGVAEGYPKHQDLSGISTDKLKAYLDKQSKQQVSGEGNQVKRVRAELQRREQSLSENAEDLHIGDPVIITGNGVEFEGATGEIIDFGRDHRFVVVDLYNHGKHSFHSSDVSFNEYAGSDDEEARMYDAGEFGDDPRDDMYEARMSAALRMANAVDKQRAKSDASLRRTPSSIPKKEEPKKVPADSGAKTVSEHRVNRQALMAKMLNSR